MLPDMSVCGFQWPVRFGRLKTLEDHNRYRGSALEKLDADRASPQPNGIACPECEAELVDTDPTGVLLSNPPKKRISCLACGYLGYRIY
ncbi:hypothetical protein [Roseibium sp. Sym1]|uniref:hypothetical protein n=1 Tax=Roseibium sp. Sym1 TaxID=3016006 RepID=UPI0022B5B682|nr:hypothetical protein [Roseibium sp. Sym1]